MTDHFHMEFPVPRGVKPSVMFRIARERFGHLKPRIIRYGKDMPICLRLTGFDEEVLRRVEYELHKEVRSIELGFRK